MNPSARNWIDYAKRDLAVVETILGNEYVANAVMYHSEQIAEKALKALFEEHGKKIPRIHSLVKLHADLVEFGILQPSVFEIKDLFFLDEVYLDSRYPGGLGLLPHGFPTTIDAQEAFEIARKTLKTVLSILE